MGPSEPVEMFAVLPDPGAARTLDELVERLGALRAWAGNPSYETIKSRVNAAWVAAGRPASELTTKTTVVNCFRRGRRRLSTDLVIAVVQALHPDPGYVAQWRQALRVVGGEARAAAQVRAQDTLPADLAEFTGRSAELDQLRQLLAGHAGNGKAVVISAIEGMAGVGKTQLAIHAGHLLARDEPFDRVLFVNLRGFHPDPAQPPADPGAVLDSFLRLLGVSGQEIPHELDVRTALYQQRLAGTRTLVVLDNAADEGQVLPLLPSSPDCITLITSRRRLTGVHAATHLAVDVFNADEALDYLAKAAPSIPVGGDPDAAAQVIRRCGRLPLALGLVAAHMRTKPGWTLTDHADRLDERHRDGKLDSGVELALSLSYQHLPPERQRLLRLLALHPGHDADDYAAAALSDQAVDAVRKDLDRLAAAHLLQRTAPGRFVFHDLVRAYATGRATDEDPRAARRAALTRLFDHYLHTAAAAMDILFPAERHRRPRLPAPGTPSPPMADPAAARRWLDTERVNLIATAGHAATHGWPGHTVQLAATLFRYLFSGGHSSEAITVHSQARHAARHTGDRVAEAQALVNLGNGYWRQSGYQEAADHYRQALVLFGEIGDRPGEARVLANLGAIYWRRGRYAQAADHAQRAVAVFRDIGDRFGEAHALANLGAIYWRRGRYAQAADHFQQALIQFRELGDRHGEAMALGGLGVTHGRLGDDLRAVDELQQALITYREVGDRAGEASMLTDLGVVHQRLGQTGQAIDHHQRAVALFHDVGYPAGEADALNGLGETLLLDGQPDQARARHTAALTLAVQVDERYQQARAHSGLADIHSTTNDLERARHHWQHALTIYTELDIPDADEVRAHLADLDGRLPSDLVH